MDLPTVWFILVFVLVAGYAVLDGFDLGVGMLHLLARGDHERRVSINAIAPVWDGNEVWLLTAGGALFAAFPPVYAAVFSGMYTAFMLLLLALIARAVAIEFRSKSESPAWRSVWDAVFWAGSLGATVLLGVAFGNVLRGMPVDIDGTWRGSFSDLLNPYALIVAAAVVAACGLHGALYLAGKADDPLRRRLLRAAWALWAAVAVLFIAGGVATVCVSAFLHDPINDTWGGKALVALALAALMAMPVALLRGRSGLAFCASSAFMLIMLALCAWGMYPRLVHSTVGPGADMTIYNSASSTRTLSAMLVIALIGMPIVLAYTVVVYRIFRGKVVVGPESY